MPLTSADRSRRYRDKLKRENPEKLEAQRLKNLQRIKPKKKKVSEMTKEEAEKRRKAWCKEKRAARQKQKTYYEFIPTPKGKNLLMWKSYTYSKMGGKFYCSSKMAGCKARVKLGKDGKIMKAEFEHLHKPPVYIKSLSGKYIKISN